MRPAAVAKALVGRKAFGDLADCGSAGGSAPGFAW